ncbi:MAG: hypothetical protein ACREIU_15410 [Planctomycetota bacterium]
MRGRSPYGHGDLALLQIEGSAGRALILYQQLRQRAAGSAFGRAQVSTLRERLV